MSVGMGCSALVASEVLFEESEYTAARTFMHVSCLMHTEYYACGIFCTYLVSALMLALV